MSTTRPDGRIAIRIPGRVAQHILSSDAATSVGQDEHAEVLARLIGWTKPRKDGSRIIPLSEVQRAVLLDYAEALADSAPDSISYETSALSDLNAARAVIRAVHATGTR